MTGSTDRFFCLAFEALQKRWDHTTETDQAERQQIIEELRQLTAKWRRVLDARELTRASLELTGR